MPTSPAAEPEVLPIDTWRLTKRSGDILIDRFGLDVRKRVPALF